MGYKLTIQDEGFTEISFDHPAELQELLEIKDLRDEHKRVLIDLSIGSALDFSRVQELLKAHDDQPPRQDVVTAILAIDNLDYGLSRIFEQQRSDLGACISVFRDKAEAVAWLTSL